MKTTIFSLLFSIIFTQLQAQSPNFSINVDDQLPYTAQNLTIGDVISYNIIVQNTGNVNLTNIYLTCTELSLSTDRVTSLNTGQSSNLTATHTVTQADIDVGEISISVHGLVSYSNLIVIRYSDDTDPASPTGNTDPTITHLVQTAQLNLVADDQLPYLPQNLSVGDQIIYEIILTNTGNVTLTNPINFTNNNATNNQTAINGLGIGDTYIFNETHSITQADIDAGQVSFSAFATTTYHGQTISATSDDVSLNTIPNEPTITHIAQTPQLTATLDDNRAYIPQNVQAGDVINYTIRVGNTGNTTLDNVVLNCQNATLSSSNLIGTLQVGQESVLSAQHAITSNEISSGQFTIQVSASTNFNGQNISDLSDDTDLASPLGNDDATITFFTQTPALSVELTGNWINCNHVEYVLKITNIGDVVLHNITTNDPLFTVNLAEIPVGNMQQFTAIYMPTSNEYQMGSITHQTTISYLSPAQIILTNDSDDPYDLTDTDNNDTEPYNDPDDASIIIISNADHDNDGVIDLVDIDDDNDGIPDLIECNGIDPLTDNDRDNVPVFLDDDDNNPNIGNDNNLVEPSFDIDGDGVPNFNDLDSDGDGLFDICESGISAHLTNTYNTGMLSNPADQYGWATTVVTATQNSVSYTITDTDTDNIYNFLDTDDDNDGIPTQSEYPDPNGDGCDSDALDSDGNGTPDYLEYSAGSITPDIKELFSVYPIPAQDILHIKTKGNHQITEIRVYNAQGQLIETEKMNRDGMIEINVKNFVNGMYFLQIRIDTHYIMYPWVKE